MALRINQFAVWKIAVGIFVKILGVWKEVLYGFHKEDGAWRVVYLKDSIPALAISVFAETVTPFSWWSLVSEYDTRMPRIVDSFPGRLQAGGSDSHQAHPASDGTDVSAQYDSGTPWNQDTFNPGCYSAATRYHTHLIPIHEHPDSAGNYPVYTGVVGYVGNTQVKAGQLIFVTELYATVPTGWEVYDITGYLRFLNSNPGIGGGIDTHGHGDATWTTEIYTMARTRNTWCRSNNWYLNHSHTVTEDGEMTLLPFFVGMKAYRATVDMAVVPSGAGFMAHHSMTESPNGYTLYEFDGHDIEGNPRYLKMDTTIDTIGGVDPIHEHTEDGNMSQVFVNNGTQESNNDQSQVAIVLSHSHSHWDHVHGERDGTPKYVDLAMIFKD